MPKLGFRYLTVLFAVFLMFIQSGTMTCLAQDASTVKNLVLEHTGSAYVGETVKINVKYVDGSGAIVSSTPTKPFAIALTSSSKELSVQMDPADKTNSTILATATEPGAFQISAALVLQPTVKTSLQLDVVQYLSKQYVRVHVEPMSTETAGKLFGSAISNDFFVCTVDIENYLKAKDGTGNGPSIIVFSDSLETSVKLEMMHPGREGWKVVTESDALKYGIHDSSPEKITIPMHAIKADKEASTDQLSIRIPASPLYFNVDGSDTTHSIIPEAFDSAGNKVAGTFETKALDDRSTVANDPKIGGARVQMKERGTGHLSIDFTPTGASSAKYNAAVYIVGENGAAHRDFIFKYRPYTYEIMNGSFDIRAQGNSDAKAFKGLNVLAQLLSFVSGFTALTHNSDDVTKFATQFSGTLIPGMRSLFPDNQSIQKQNLVTLAMRLREEVPSGAKISRVIFYPKKPFTGLVGNNQTRISSINTANFSVDVAAVADKTSVAGSDPSTQSGN
jgi:hypothetical protein